MPFQSSKSFRRTVITDRTSQRRYKKKKKKPKRLVDLSNYFSPRHKFCISLSNFVSFSRNDILNGTMLQRCWSPLERLKLTLRKQQMAMKRLKLKSQGATHESQHQILPHITQSPTSHLITRRFCSALTGGATRYRHLSLQLPATQFCLGR